jgi:hypothetical protein
MSLFQRKVKEQSNFGLVSSRLDLCSIQNFVQSTVKIETIDLHAL